MLQIEPSASCLLGKHTTSELYPQAKIFLKFGKKHFEYRMWVFSLNRHSIDIFVMKGSC
jgi:hypothetical protein